MLEIIHELKNEGDEGKCPEIDADTNFVSIMQVIISSSSRLVGTENGVETRVQSSCAHAAVESDIGKKKD